MAIICRFLVIIAIVLSLILTADAFTVTRPLAKRTMHSHDSISQQNMRINSLLRNTMKMVASEVKVTTFTPPLGPDVTLEYDAVRHVPNLARNHSNLVYCSLLA